jgi:quercetin dioxygenase-like cupin family protein
MPFINLDDFVQSQPVPGFKGRFVHSENITVACWKIDAGSSFPEHSHPHEQVSIVDEGEFELTIEGKTKKLYPGLVAVIPSSTPHSGRALTNCRLIDVFYPVREDYR